MRVFFAKYASYRRPQFRVRTLLIEDDGVRYAIKEPLTEEAKPHVSALLDAPTTLASSHPAFKFIEGEKCGDGVRYAFVRHSSLEDDLAEKVRKSDFTAFSMTVAEFSAKLREGATEQDWSSSSQFRAVFGSHSAATAPCLCPANVDLTFSNVLLSNEGPLIIDPEWVFDFPVPVDFILYRALRQFAMTYTSDVASIGMDKLMESCGLDRSSFAMFKAMELTFQKYVFGELGLSGVPKRVIRGKDPVGFYSVGRKSIYLRESRVWYAVAPLHQALNFARRVKRRLLG